MSSQMLQGLLVAGGVSAAMMTLCAPLAPSNDLRCPTLHAVASDIHLTLTLSVFLLAVASQSAPGANTLIRAQSENSEVQRKLKSRDSGTGKKILKRAPSGDFVHAMYPEVKARSVL